MSIQDIINFAKNPDDRCPIMLLLDTSDAMKGPPIKELNDGIVTFKQELQLDDQAKKRVELAIITCGGDQPQLVEDFTTVNHFQPSPLTASGNTHTGKAIELALNLLEKRQAKYKLYNMSYYQPWLFLITANGALTDKWKNVAQQVKQAEINKKLNFFTVAAQNPDLNILGQLSQKPPVSLDSLKFKQLFIWLSDSMKKVAHSKIGEQVDLPPISSFVKPNQPTGLGNFPQFPDLLNQPTGLGNFPQFPDEIQ